MTLLSGFQRALAMALACTALIVLLPGPASAGLPQREFGPLIDEPAGYDGQRTCDPTAKPGVKSFRSFVLRHYPFTGYGGIGRRCSIGGRSEHKEGRAWDWTVNVSVRRERRAARQVLNWLTAPDQHGNETAMARRLGIMYIIWNRQMWSSWSGEWAIYCVQNKRKCRNADGEVRHPHTDHVHFSFGWPGARKQTTWWNRELSYPAPEPTPTDPAPTP